MKDTRDIPVNHDGTKKVETKGTDVLNDKSEEVTLSLVEGLAKNQEALNKENVRLTNALEELKIQMYALEALIDQSEIRKTTAGKPGLQLLEMSEAPHNEKQRSGPKMKLRNETKSAWKL